MGTIPQLVGSSSGCSRELGLSPLSDSASHCDAPNLTSFHCDDYHTPSISNSGIQGTGSHDVIHFFSGTHLTLTKVTHGLCNCFKLGITSYRDMIWWCVMGSMKRGLLDPSGPISYFPQVANHTGLPTPGWEISGDFQLVPMEFSEGTQWGIIS